MKIVLVIEDNPLHAKLIRKSLCSNQGTMVTVAETAKLALDALTGGSEDVAHPDLILLDMQLPDSTGLDVLRSKVGDFADTANGFVWNCDLKFGFQFDDEAQHVDRIRAQILGQRRFACNLFRI